MLEAEVSLADVVTCACPSIAVDLLILSPELRRLAKLSSCLALGLAHDEGVSSLIEIIRTSSTFSHTYITK